MCFLDPFFPGSLPPVCVCALVHAHAPILPGLFLETLAKTLKKCRENDDGTLSKKGKGQGETSGSAYLRRPDIAYLAGQVNLRCFISCRSYCL